MGASDSIAVISKLGGEISQILMPGHDKDALSILPLKTSKSSKTFKADLAGRAGIIKLFTPHKRKNDPFERERWALDLLHSEFVPKLLFVSVPDRLIMTDFIDGQTLAEIIKSHNMLRNAEHLGQWFGKLSNISPRKPSGENWQSYLQKYDTGFDTQVLQGGDVILQSTPITRMLVAHNDNDLSNFILGTDKKLYGVDFETSRFKPEGWDMITASRFMFRKFPDHLDIIVDAMCRGYNMTAIDSTLPECFDAVIKVVAVANIATSVTN